MKKLFILILVSILAALMMTDCSCTGNESLKLVEAERQKIVNDLFSNFDAQSKYFVENPYKELTKNIRDRTAFFDTAILEYVYNSSKLYDSITGLTGAYNDIFDRKELEKYSNIKNEHLFSDRILYGYTESGLHIIVILPIENKDEAINGFAMNEIRSDPFESKVLNPLDSVFDIFIEDLTEKKQQFEVSIKVKGFGFHTDDYEAGREDWFLPYDSIPSDIVARIEQYGRTINTSTEIFDQTWNLFVVNKGDFNRFWSYGIELTIDGEVVFLESLDENLISNYIA